MSDPDDFLSRWSRRKRAVAEEATAVPAQGLANQHPEQINTGVAAVETGPKEDAAFDLSKLPSLDSIGPGTDIKMFMQPGVPAALSRAALRRAWSADPGIRDFIGLSENSWDFTVPNSITGFGELDPGEAARLLASAFGELAPPESAAEQHERKAEHPVKTIAGTPEQTLIGDVRQVEATGSEVAAVEAKMLCCESNHSASQQSIPLQGESSAPIRRTHGGALPE